MKLDLRLRCQRCRKLIRGKVKEREYEIYKPFCSYSCQQWWALEEAERYLEKNYGSKR